MLRSEVEFDGPRVMAIFETIRAELPAELARFVAGKLSQRFGAPTGAN